MPPFGSPSHSLYGADSVCTYCTEYTGTELALVPFRPPQSGSATPELGPCWHRVALLARLLQMQRVPVLILTREREREGARARGSRFTFASWLEGVRAGIPNPHERQFSSMVSCALLLLLLLLLLLQRPPRHDRPGARPREIPALSADGTPDFVSGGPFSPLAHTKSGTLQRYRLQKQTGGHRSCSAREVAQLPEPGLYFTLEIPTNVFTPSSLDLPPSSVHFPPNPLSSWFCCSVPPAVKGHWLGRSLGPSDRFCTVTRYLSTRHQNRHFPCLSAPAGCAVGSFQLLPQSTKCRPFAPLPDPPSRHVGYTTLPIVDDPYGFEADGKEPSYYLASAKPNR